MSSSLTLVLEHLTANQQQIIVDDILKHLKEIQENDSENTYIDTLCALLDQSPQLEGEVQDFAYDYAVGILNFEDPSLHFHSILKLSLKIKQLPIKLMAYVVEKLKLYLTTYPRHFDDNFVKNLELDFGRDKDYDLSSGFILNLLKFTDWYLINNEFFSEKYYDNTLDRLCFMYLTNEEIDISKTSSKVLKWRMPSVCQTDESSTFLWKVIFLLEASGDKTEISYGYILWLRYFNFFKPANLKNNQGFQLVLSKEKYWLFLRDGLISLTHEHKKFALTLIQLSIQSLATNLSLPIIKWDCARETEYVESWKRFCTLYEILGIDAAMNQVQAASNDLLNVFAPDSDIPVPFSLTILSVGFKASMDRIKSFALNLTFSLPKESLSLFKNDFKFISHVFLPFTMKSFHFTVFKSMDGNYSCQFGEKITEFISNCVESLSNSLDITKLVSLIFDVISENRLTFGIARIYIVWGVLNGLQKKGNLVLESSILPSLLPLFETVAEGNISKTTLQTIHLRILLHLDPASVNLRSYLHALVYFIQNNGFSLYAENEEFFLDYFNANFGKNEFVELLTNNTHILSPEEFIVISSYLLSKKTDVSMITPSLLSHPKNHEVLIQMAVCGLDLLPIWKNPLIISCIERFVEEMAIGSKKFDISIYSDCQALFRNSFLFSSQFWESMPLNSLFSEVSNSLINVDNMEEAYYLIAQFKFITVCFGKCIYNETFAISFDSLKLLLNNALQKVPRGSDTRFYKAKDELISLILQNITSLFKISVFDENFKNGVLNLANDVISMSEYHSHLSNVRMIAEFLDSSDQGKILTVGEASSIVSSLRLIWDDLVKDRLVLNQRDLHQAFIRLVLHKKLLVFSINQKDLAESLLTILEQVIENSSSRKGLLPCMFKAVSDYQVSEEENFEKTLWLARLLVKGVFVFQSELNIFQLDCTIAQKFDKFLNISGESLYTTVYGDPEVSYRANIFAVAASLKAETFSSEIWKFIFENDSMFHLIRPKKRTGHEEQWKRIQLLSLLTSTHGVLKPSELLPYMKNHLLPRLFKEASPLCRAYIEWLLCLTIIRMPAFKEDVFGTLKEGFEAQQPLVVVSFERISMLISMQLPKEEETKFLTQFVADVIIPTSSSNRALNRHFSSSMACLIYDQIVSREIDFPPLMKNSLKKIHEIAHKAEGYGSYRSGDAILWDITKDCNLVSITGGLLLKVCDRVIDAIYQADYENYLTEKQKSILRLPIGHDEKELWIACDRKEQVKLESFYADADNENEKSSLLQTKSGAWSTVMELDENVRAAAQIKRSPLIVVSSLVDKAPNLGGICRLCDCLGAGWMAVDDLTVKNNSEFKSVAVTADRWMPLIEVKIQDIIDFMRLKKKEGYTLIGLEQTDKSVELNGDLKFPEKSLILLGKEKEGIPGDLLAELDMCVIIKQVGIVRSMNIQTATAVIVHAYSSQHC